jgi:curved DNA-binding protein CbpA
MVSQWHPDRLGSRTEKVRQFATEKTVEINSAYRLLRSAMRQKSI